MTKKQIEKQIKTVKHWYHQIELYPGLVTPGINHSSLFLKQLKLPKNCQGMRVLDIGARDGFFSFEMEKRGATVIALDYVPAHTTGFNVAKKILKSKKVSYRQDNIYNITPKKYGKFDIVLFLGLLYHLPDPIRALNIVRSVCRRYMYIETQGIDNAFLNHQGDLVPLESVSPQLSQIPIMQFYPKNSLNNDPSNYWAPNLACLKGMLQETGFKVNSSQTVGSRLIARCQTTIDKQIQKVMDMATGKTKPKSW